MIRFMRRVKIATLRSSKRLVTRFIMQLKAKSLRPIASISRTPRVCRPQVGNDL